MATKKSISKKATTKRATKKATKKVASKTKKHALIIQVSEKNGDCKNEFTFQGDLDIVAMAISKQAHADENFRAFFYYLIKNVGKHSEKILKATKTKTRAKAKK